MTRIPPSLSYLTIYNPTLQPIEPSGDDEDAIEQAHILFYTSKERAVSRDRILRQIGLAKALVSFVEQFSAGDPCNNVHSQSRRLVMVSPEPNFWIHACIDVAKIARTSDSKPKPKSTSKSDKGKAIAIPQYEYEDGSVYDGPIRARILNGYERFKLTHGSFTSILGSLGQQALELQLERFWTVWAWSWDMDENPEFGEGLGPRLHPYFSSLIPFINDFASTLSSTTTPVVLSREHIIPSSRFTECRHPAALAHHLSFMIPPPSTSSGTLNTLAASVETIRGRPPAEANAAGSSSEATKSSSFLGMSSMNVKMDMKKWSWPGYLTFGKGGSTKPSIENVATLSTPAENEQHKDVKAPTENELEQSRLEVQVNADDLQDAIASDAVSISQKRASSFQDNLLLLSEQANGSAGEDLPNLHEKGSLSLDLTGSTTTHYREETPPLLPEFSLTRLHLASCKEPTATKGVSIHYFIRDGYMLALLHMQEQADEIESESADLQRASKNAVNLFDDIYSTIQNSDIEHVPNPPSATALQPEDRYLISAGQYTIANPGFTSDSSHLFNAKTILDINPGIHEVFSRGQNPQYWHVAKRGLGTNSLLNLTGSDGEVFVEVFRKEASLTEVDNMLLSAVRRSGLVDGHLGSK